MKLNSRSLFKYIIFLSVLALFIGVLPGQSASAQSQGLTFKPVADAFVIQGSKSG
jgi:hypothetical protein